MEFGMAAEFARWPRAKAEALVELVKTLERAPDLTRITAMPTA